MLKIVNPTIVYNDMVCQFARAYGSKALSLACKCLFRLLPFVRAVAFTFG